MTPSPQEPRPISPRYRRTEAEAEAWGRRAGRIAERREVVLWLERHPTKTAAELKADLERNRHRLTEAP